MGVMGCNRRGCSSVCCNRLSSEFGYICDECFEELVESGPTTNIDHFLATIKRNLSEMGYEVYDIEFPKCHE